MDYIPETPWTITDGVLVGEDHRTDGDPATSFDIFDADEWPGGIEEGRAIARFIERRVNSHETMIATIRDLLCIIDVNAPNTFENNRHCKKARALLAEVTS